MLKRTRKIIWILSPQYWGNMRVSKHHYAISYANLGYDVIFLNPPKQGKLFGKAVYEIQNTEFRRLKVLQIYLNFPYELKFHAYSLYCFLMWKQIVKVIKKTTYPDIVLSFDMSGNYHLRYFTNAKKIYFPADEPRNKFATGSWVSANLLVSVTPEILKKYPNNLKKLLVHHGISEDFLREHSVNRDILCRFSRCFKFHCGLSGNFLRPEIDFYTLNKIISNNNNVFFHIYGSYSQKGSNLGGDLENIKWIKMLENRANVHFYDVISTKNLSYHLNCMDMFLICYDVKKDQSGGTNYHKIMEYLSTGKVVVSNNVSRFSDGSNLLEMATERENNDEMPFIFNRVVCNLEKYNSEENIRKRKLFAKSNSYEILAKMIIKD